MITCVINFILVIVKKELTLLVSIIFKDLKF